MKKGDYNTSGKTYENILFKPKKYTSSKLVSNSITKGASGFFRGAACKFNTSAKKLLGRNMEPVECLEKCKTERTKGCCWYGLPSVGSPLYKSCWFYKNGRAVYEGGHTSKMSTNINKDVQNDPVDLLNNNSFSCSNPRTTYATYNANTLTQKQKDMVNKKWPGKPPSYYASVQGCKGTSNFYGKLGKGSLSLN